MGQRRVQSSYSAPTMVTWTLLRWYVTTKQELNSAVCGNKSVTIIAQWHAANTTEDPVTG